MLDRESAPRRELNNTRPFLDDRRRVAGVAAIAVRSTSSGLEYTGAPLPIHFTWNKFIHFPLC